MLTKLRQNIITQLKIIKYRQISYKKSNIVPHKIKKYINTDIEKINNNIDHKQLQLYNLLENFNQNYLNIKKQLVPNIYIDDINEVINIYKKEIDKLILNNIKDITKIKNEINNLKSNINSDYLKK